MIKAATESQQTVKMTVKQREKQTVKGDGEADGEDDGEDDGEGRISRWTSVEKHVVEVVVS